MNPKKQIYNMSAEDALETPKLGLDDTFQFHCKACGRCCKNREDIILSSFDVYRLARYFGRSMKDIVDRYCDVAVGASTCLPIVSLCMQPPKRACPFLRNKRCGVHSVKPSNCRMYPLARIYELDKPAKFYQIDASCHHDAEPLTVRNWIAEFADDEIGQIGRLWNDVCIPLSASFNPIVFSCSKEVRSEVFDEIFSYLYIQYDPSKEYTRQLVDNNAALRHLLLEKYDLEVSTMAEYSAKMREELSKQGIQI